MSVLEGVDLRLITGPVKEYISRFMASFRGILLSSFSHAVCKRSENTQARTGASKHASGFPFLFLRAALAMDWYEAKGNFFHVIKRLTLVCWLVGTLKVGNKKADPAADIVLVGLK